MSWSRRRAATVGAAALLVGGALLFLRVLSTPARREFLPAPQEFPAPDASASEVGQLVVNEPWRTCRREPERSVERALVMPLFGPQPSHTAKFGFMTPEFDNGVLRGVRLSGVGPTSVLARLGFENGDRIESINGFPMNDLERLRTSQQLDLLTVIVNRGGVGTCLEFKLMG
jgi:membrane-associated protease RseP (regulator of RpoE activity)